MFYSILIICLQTVKLFQVLLCITNKSIKHQSFVYAVKSKNSFISNHSIYHKSSVALSLNIKQFYLTHGSEPTRCYHSESEWTWEWWQWRDILHSPNLQYWDLNIRLFCVICRTLVGGNLTPQPRFSRHILLPQPNGLNARALVNK